MLQRLIAAVLGVLGLAAIALGIASATVWRPDDTLTATARSAEGTTLLTTAPGVLELGDPPVTVRARAADGAQAVLVVGRDTDVSGWIGTDAHTRVTGLSDWDTLATDDVEATEPQDAADEEPAEGEDAAAAQPAPDPSGSDLWIDEVTGDGTAQLIWTPREERWTVLAATTGEDAGPVTLELSWPRTVTTPWLVPGVVGGAVLLLLAGLLALRARRAARRQDDWYVVTTGATPVVDADLPVSTRRERRDVAAGAPEPVVDREAMTGEVPVSEGVARSASAPGAATTSPDRTPPVVVPGSVAGDESRDDVPTPEAASARPPTDDAPAAGGKPAARLGGQLRSLRPGADRGTDAGGEGDDVPAPATTDTSGTPSTTGAGRAPSPLVGPGAADAPGGAAWRRTWGIPGARAPGEAAAGPDAAGPDAPNDGKDVR